MHEYSESDRVVFDPLNAFAGSGGEQRLLTDQRTSSPAREPDRHVCAAVSRAAHGYEPR
jgi:hypothetical protein